jgi:phage protein D
MSIQAPVAALLSSSMISVQSIPRLRVIANGGLVSGAIGAEVITNNYYGSDRFSASLALGMDPLMGAAFWSTEADIDLEIQFSLDGGASFTSMVQGAVDCVTMDPIRGVVHLTGRDLTAPLIEARTQETFANHTASEIATLLASRHDLTANVTATTTPVGRYYQSEHDAITLDQFSKATTEWDLLVFLALHEGCDVFVQGRTLYFQPSAQLDQAVLTLNPADVIDLRLERSLVLAQEIEVIVKSWNSRQNSALVQNIRSSGQDGTATPSSQVQSYIYVKPNLTSDAAMKLATQKLAQLTRHERVLEIRLPGELQLTPRDIIALEGTNTDFDQSYYVDVIERRLTYEGGMTEFIRAQGTSPRAGS